MTPGIDVDGLANQLDAHEIKEQVSDLVVERLDARLANQNAERTEVIVGRIHEMMQESVVNGLEPIPEEISSISGKLATIHSDVSEPNPEDLASLRDNVVNIIADLPPSLVLPQNLSMLPWLISHCNGSLS